jgi:hypothetical protein
VRASSSVPDYYLHDSRGYDVPRLPFQMSRARARSPLSTVMQYTTNRAFTQLLYLRELSLGFLQDGECSGRRFPAG